MSQSLLQKTPEFRGFQQCMISLDSVGRLAGSSAGLTYGAVWLSSQGAGEGPLVSGPDSPPPASRDCWEVESGRQRKAPSLIEALEAPESFLCSVEQVTRSALIWDSIGWASYYTPGSGTQEALGL